MTLRIEAYRVKGCRQVPWRLHRELLWRRMRDDCAHKAYSQSRQIIARVKGFGGGLEGAHRLAQANIITNKNLIPEDRPEDWDHARGLRVGTIEVTRLGMNENEMETIADFIARVLVRGKIRNRSEKMSWTSACPDRLSTTILITITLPGPGYKSEFKIPLLFSCHLPVSDSMARALVARHQLLNFVLLQQAERLATKLAESLARETGLDYSKKEKQGDFPERR